MFKNTSHAITLQLDENNKPIVAIVKMSDYDIQTRQIDDAWVKTTSMKKRQVK